MKTIPIVALALAVAFAVPSLGWAQTETGTANEAVTTDAGGDFWTGSWMRDFYTDDAMTTMKPSSDAKATYMKMNQETKDKLKVACAGTYDRKYSDICMAAKDTQ